MRCNRMISVSLLSFVLLSGVNGCFTAQHRVGAGAQGSATIEERQWYAIWGLIPINRVDSQRMARGATDYDVTTEMNVLDIIINVFIGVVSSQTVTVKR